LRKDQRRGIVAIPVVHEDGGRHELRDAHKTYEQDDGGEHHLKDAEAPFAAAAFCEYEWHSCFFSLVFQLANPLPGAAGRSGPNLYGARGKQNHSAIAELGVGRAAKVEHVGGQRQNRATRVEGDRAVAARLRGQRGPAQGCGDGCRTRATPEGKRAANPEISCCFSVASTDPLLSESVPTIQPSTLVCIRKLICLFRRTASNRVNFNMSATRAAALLSWYVRNERIIEGMATAVRIRTTVSETASSTMLKPRLRLR